MRFLFISLLFLFTFLFVESTKRTQNFGRFFLLTSSLAVFTVEFSTLSPKNEKSQQTNQICRRWNLQDETRSVLENTTNIFLWDESDSLYYTEKKSHYLELPSLHYVGEILSQERKWRRRKRRKIEYHTRTKISPFCLHSFWTFALDVSCTLAKFIFAHTIKFIFRSFPI